MVRNNYPMQGAFYPLQNNQMTCAYVQGESAAKAYPIAPGQFAVLLDSESNTLYTKTTDQFGRPLPIGEMIDVIKDVETVYAMKEYEPEDWMRGYSRGYDEDYSMTRMPYSRRYSRDDEKHEMIEHLNTMMMNARTPEERESYRSAIEHMRRS